MVDVAIFGLGNPGAEYQDTKHNLGFIILDYIACLNNLLWQHKKKLHAEITEYKKENKKILFIKPITFMNNSGVCVQSLLNYYKIDPQKTVVIYDDMDLDFCKVRCKFAGSSAGHNGIKSIDKAIGQEYFRVRIGIDRPSFMNSADYVLQNFSKSELRQVKAIAEILSEQILRFSDADLSSMIQVANYINNTNLNQITK